MKLVDIFLDEYGDLQRWINHGDC